MGKVLGRGRGAPLPTPLVRCRAHKPAATLCAVSWGVILPGHASKVGATALDAFPSALRQSPGTCPGRMKGARRVMCVPSQRGLRVQPGSRRGGHEPWRVTAAHAVQEPAQRGIPLPSDENQGMPEHGAPPHSSPHDVI